jgi:hypothetical protein
MAVSSSDVEIRINVVDTTSGEVITDLTNAFGKLGEAGVANGKRIGEGMHEAGSGAHEAKERLHLLSEEVGIHIPRAFRGLVTGSKAAQTALAGVGMALTGIGAIQLGMFVFDEAVENVKKLYEKYLDVDGVVREYQEHARQAAEQKLFDEGAIQTQISMMQDVNHEIDELLKKKREASGFGNFMASFLMGNGFEYYSPKDEKKLDELMTRSDQAMMSGIEKERKFKLDQLQNREAMALAGQPDYAKSAVTRRFDYQRAQIGQEFDQRRDQAQTNIVNRGELEAAKKEHRAPNFRLSPADVGWQERQQAEQAADVKAKSAEIERNRATALEIRKLEDQGRQASLRGIALLEDQRKVADRDWVTQHGSSTRAIAAIDAKYYADEQKLIRQLRSETEQLQGEAALPLFRGIGLTQAQSDLAVAKIHDSTDLDEGTKDARIKAEQERLQNELLNSQRQYTEEIDGLVESSDQRQLTGFARITAEKMKQLDDLKRKFDETYGQMDRSKPGAEQVYQQGAGDYSRGQAAINGSADWQRHDLARRNEEEIAQLEAQARARLLSAEKQQSAAIASEYEERLRKYREDLNAQVASGLLTRNELLAVNSDYNRKVIAAGQLRDAQMVESARQAREKMAGEFSRFFQNPLSTLKEMGDKAAGEAAAALVQRVQGRFGGATAGSASTGIFDRIAGMPHGGDRPWGVRGATNTGSTAIAQAVIQVQNGTVVLSGGGAGSAAPSAALSTFAPAAGSTSLMGMGGFASQGSTAASADAGMPSVASAADGGAGVAAGAGGGAMSNTLGNVQQSVGLFKQARSIFGGTSGSTSDAGTGGFADTTSSIIPGSFGKNGTFSSGSTNGGMMGGGGFGANAAGAAGGAMGLFSAYEGNGGAGGALGGAMSGMKLGMALGGPMGAAIGAAAGAIVGAIGFGGREKARVYDLKEVRPRITSDLFSFQSGTMDYTSAYSDLQGLNVDARKTLEKMGPAAKSYYWDTVDKEIKQAEGRLTGEARAGRADYTMSQGSYATGTDRVPGEGAYILHDRESVLTAARTDRQEAATRALEDAADTKLPVQTGFGGDIHFHVNAIDSKSVAQFFSTNKHQIRSALNASYAENSGGADA